MRESALPNVTPEKLSPIIKTADADRMGTLYRLTHHLICGYVPADCSASAEDFLRLFRDGTDRQRLLIYQVAYHLIRKGRSI